MTSRDVATQAFELLSPDTSFGGSVTIWPNSPSSGSIDLVIESVQGPSAAIGLTPDLARLLATHLDQIARRLQGSNQ